MGEKATVRCPTCSRRIRIPVIEGAIEVPCPCGHRFHCRSGKVVELRLEPPDELLLEHPEWYSHRPASFLTPSRN